MIGPGGDLPRKADILVSEILDSALLGEGVLPFLRHALTELVIENAIVVPQSARLYAQAVDLPAIADTHDLSAPAFETISLLRDGRAGKCKGARPLLPVHVGTLRTKPIAMSPELTVFNFDFRTPSSRRVCRSVSKFSV